MKNIKSIQDRHPMCVSAGEICFLQQKKFHLNSVPWKIHAIINKCMRSHTKKGKKQYLFAFFRPTHRHKRHKNMINDKSWLCFARMATKSIKLDSVFFFAFRCWKYSNKKNCGCCWAKFNIIMSRCKWTITDQYVDLENIANYRQICERGAA